MAELTGWLLDVYPGAGGLTVWLLGEDGVRHCLRQSFPVTFYAALQPEADAPPPVQPALFPPAPAS